MGRPLRRRGPRSARGAAAVTADFLPVFVAGFVAGFAVGFVIQGTVRDLPAPHGSCGERFSRVDAGIPCVRSIGGTVPLVSPAISIVIPCHNEASLLPDVLTSLRVWLAGERRTVEVVLVENGSSDTTLSVAFAAEAEGIGAAEVKILTLPVGDYGAAIRAGLSASTGDVVAVLDCDMVDIGFVERSTTLLAADPGLGAVLSSKLASGSSDERSRYRRAGTRVFSGIVRLLTGTSLVDTHGNKALRGEAARVLVDSVRENGSLFDTELLVRMEREGWTFSELPTTIVEKRPPRSRYLSRVPATLRGLIRLRRALN